MRPAMTPQEQNLMRFLAQFRADHDYPPTYRQIMTAMGWRSTSAPNYWLKALEDRGLIEREPGQSRAVRIVGNAARWLPAEVAS